MELFYLLVICLKCIATENTDDEYIFHIPIKYFDELLGDVSNAVINLSKNKNYVVVEDTELEEDKDLFFLEFSRSALTCRYVPEHKTTVKEYSSNFSKCFIRRKDMKIKEVTKFIRERSRNGVTPLVYFTIDFGSDVLSPDDLKTVKEMKVMIQEKVFPRDSCSLKFFNYKLKSYAERLIELNTDMSLIGKEDAPFMENTLEKEFKERDSVVVSEGEKYRIVFLLSGNVMKEVKDIAYEYDLKTAEDRGEDFCYDYKKNRTLVLKHLKEFNNYSIESIKEKAMKDFKIFNFYINFILASETLEEDLQDVTHDFIDEDLHKTIISLSANLPDKDKVEAWSCKKGHGEIWSLVVECLQHIEKNNPKAFDDNEAHLVAAFLKSVASDENLLRRVAFPRSENYQQTELFSYFGRYLKMNFYRYIQKWVEDFAKYTHQETSTLQNEHYQTILNALSTTKLVNPSEVEEPIPYWIFVRLCKEVQYESEWNQFDGQRYKELRNVSVAHG